MAINDGLIAYYPINGNALDVSGNAYNASLSGSPSLTTNQLGRSNMAYSFNGTTQNLISPTVNIGAIDGYTVCFWMNPTAQSTRSRPVNMTDTNLFTCYYGNASGGNTNLAWFTGNGTTFSSAFVASSFVTFGSWQFVCITYDKVNGRLYKNGQLFQTGAYASGAINFNSRIAYGATTTPSDLCTGSFGDLRVYNRVLSDAEIQTLYTATSGSHSILQSGTYATDGMSNLGVDSTGLIGLWDGATMDKSGKIGYAGIGGAVSFSSDTFGNYAQFAGDGNFTLGTGTRANLSIGNPAILNFTQATDFSWSSTFTITSLQPNAGSGIFGSGFDSAVYLSTSSTMDVYLRGASITNVSFPSYWATRLGEVHTISFTYVASTTRFYVYLDGVLQNAGGTLGPATFLTNNWLIGDDAIGGGNSSSCGKRVYKCMVFNRQLTAIEHSQLAKINLASNSQVKGKTYATRFTSNDALVSPLRMRLTKGNLSSNSLNSL